MEKDLCILINGATRVHIESIKECIENYKKLFSWASFDVFLHTWKTEDNREEQLRSSVDHFICNRNPYTQEELDLAEIPYTYQLRQNPQYSICRISHYSTYKAIGELLTAAEASGNTYKHALRCRNDLFIKIDTSEWGKIIEQEPLAYILPPNVWCVGAGSNDHFGFGKFETVKNIWTPDEWTFKSVLGTSHNFEYAVETFIHNARAKVHIREPESYIVKRLGRTDHNFTEDWKLR